MSSQMALEALVNQRESMMDQLKSPVTTGDLSSLRKQLELLQDIDNLQLTIDEEYLPVENMYSVLR